MARRISASLALAALSAVCPFSVVAAEQASNTAQPKAEAGALSEAQVRRVDQREGRVTLQHGPLANLAMPAMTMVFQVKDRAMLEGVKEGDRVRFIAEDLNGKLTVTRLERLR